MKKIAIVLAGCGVFDGAEIHEAVLSMLAIQKQGAEFQLFAPDIAQSHVINHLSGEIMTEERNVLIESARIARGNIKALSMYNAAEFDALIFPGGFGVAKNLCNFAFKGSSMEVLPEVINSIQETHQMNKPIGAMCISPVIIAKLLPGTELTIGNDVETSVLVEELGGKHKIANFTEVISDKKNKIFTTPCYMLQANLVQIAKGTENLISKVIEACI
ncbi:MAG: isoprenoid biosynthesis glyoxalase ElbB [Bacteroidales bacterium]|jgi:enhancing lycopene biosynthesis protein 2|nr:isoprenoid biosynthesis glyoxalase ElbB [Bacteroidales bacterium]